MTGQHVVEIQFRRQGCVTLASAGTNVTVTIAHPERTLGLVELTARTRVR